MYVKTEWKDHQVERPRTYSLVENEDGTVTLTPVTGDIYQQGTPVNAVNLNKREAGIADAHLFSRAFLQVWLNFKRWVTNQFSLLFSVAIRTDIEQEFETTKQDQARANINAMKKVGESTALQKGDGEGDTEDATPDEDYAPAVIHVAGTLAAASWTGSEAPYAQTIVIAGMTEGKKAIVGLPATATSAQYLAALAALLHVTSQGADTITVTAEGDAPEIDIPVLVQILGG